MEQFHPSGIYCLDKIIDFERQLKTPADVPVGNFLCEVFLKFKMGVNQQAQIKTNLHFRVWTYQP
jgi:hypothetical protein